MSSNGRIFDTNDLVQFLVEQSNLHREPLKTPKLPYCIWVYRDSHEATSEDWHMGEKIYRVPVEEVKRCAKDSGKNPDDYFLEKNVCLHMGRFIE